jgi:DHA1 family tetracycline resistance protein-like MFS transporter
MILLLSRIVAGRATERAVAQAYVADVTDEKDRTKGMGKIGASLGAGFILGPAVGGLLSEFGFSIPCFVAVGLTIAHAIYPKYE